jgi:hypothetical protein
LFTAAIENLRLLDVDVDVGGFGVPSGIAFDDDGDEGEESLASSESDGLNPGLLSL